MYRNKRGLLQTNLAQAMSGGARTTSCEQPPTDASKMASRKGGLEVGLGDPFFFLAGEHVKAPSFGDADPLNDSLEHRQQQRNEPQKH